MRITAASIHSAGDEMDASPAILTDTWAVLGHRVLRRAGALNVDSVQIYREAIEEWLEQAEAATDAGEMS